MSSEVETLGAASAGAVSQKTKADLSGQPCQNCGTDVSQRFCRNCGQLAASFHRPFWSLIGETISDLFALDGRLARTLPMLLFRPGRLTKAYISGQRARFVPPFRMFLLASLSFYLALFSVIGDADWLTDIELDDPSSPIIVVGTEGGSDLVPGAEEIEGAETPVIPELDGLESEELDIVAERVENIARSPDAFLRNLEKWAPRLSILLVPMTILALALLHFWRRSIYVYDHAIHALHLHSWVYLTGTIVLLANTQFGGEWSGWYGLAIIAYVWRSLVVSYDANWLMAFVRLLILMLFWLAAFFAQALAAVIISGVSVSGS